mgnify:CR=1 FL=1|jgi:hypothetical protein
MSNDNSKPAEPVRLTKIGDRRWTTGDLCITVTLTITSHPPAVRGLDSVKVRRYRATRKTDDGRTVEVATATSFADIRHLIAQWQADRDAAR